MRLGRDSLTIRARIKVRHVVVELPFMPLLFLAQLALNHEANLICLACTACRLAAVLDALVEDALELLLDVGDGLPLGWVAVPLPSFLVRLPHELDRVA